MSGHNLVFSLLTHLSAVGGGVSETLAEKMARLHDLECEQAAMALLRERARRGDKGAKAQFASLKSA